MLTLLTSRCQQESGSTFCILRQQAQQRKHDSVSDVPLIQTCISQAFLPLLGTDRSRKGEPGRVVFMGSIYGSYALPWQAAYCKLLPTTHLLHVTAAFRMPVRFDTCDCHQDCINRFVSMHAYLLVALKCCLLLQVPPSMHWKV